MLTGTYYLTCLSYYSAIATKIYLRQELGLQAKIVRAYKTENSTRYYWELEVYG